MIMVGTRDRTAWQADGGRRTAGWRIESDPALSVTIAREERLEGQPSPVRSVTGDLAAVDVQVLAGDVRRGLQEQDRVHHVADLADPPERG
jgi:hypothetical protein